MTTRSWTSEAFSQLTMEDPLFLISPFMPTGGTAVLHGPPGVGKTQLALTLTKALVKGEAFLSPEYPTRASRVLLVECDITPHLLHERLRLAALVHSNFMVTLPDPGSELICHDPTWQPSKDPGLQDALRFAPDVIIVDTLRDIHRWEESDSDTPNKVLHEWRSRFRDAAIILIHHDRKIQLMNGQSPERYWKESARGSSAWLAKADVGLHLTDAKGALSLMFTKTRTCGPLAPIALKQDPRTLLFELADPNSRQKLIGWIALNPNGRREAAMEFLQEDGVGLSRAKVLVAEYLGNGHSGRPRKTK